MQCSTVNEHQLLLLLSTHIVHIHIKPWLQLRFDYNKTIRYVYTTIPRRIRLRRKWSKLRFDCDTTTTYRARLLPFDASKKLTCQFFVVVVSQSNRSQIVISITSVVVECVVASSSNRTCDIGFIYFPGVKLCWEAGDEPDGVVYYARVNTCSFVDSTT